MAGDYENLYNLDNLSDDELRELVYQQFREIPEIDADLVDVEVESGAVRLGGRVGTEQELQQIEHVVTDIIGVSSVRNELVIDELVRGERSQAADDAAAEELSNDPQGGTGARRTEDSARHLLGDTAAELYGTHDPHQAVEEGLIYEPPDRPVQKEPGHAKTTEAQCNSTEARIDRADRSGSLVCIGCAGADQPRARSFRLATTTSVEDTGLLDSLQSAFSRKHPSIRMTAVSGGTGEVLEIARRGDADLTITHDPAAESVFVANGVSAYRRELMHNDFVIAGPGSDPARLHGIRDAAAALKKLSEQRAPFVSRGDDSGTHRKERMLWKAVVDRIPSGDWYIEAGAGMGDALRLASSRQAYILTDRGTYLRLKSQLSLDILVEGDPRLLNRYGLLRIRNAVGGEAADSFAAWILSPEGMSVIGQFGVNEFGRPLFKPVH